MRCVKEVNVVITYKIDHNQTTKGFRGVIVVANVLDFQTATKATLYLKMPVNKKHITKVELRCYTNVTIRLFNRVDLKTSNNTSLARLAEI